MKLECFVESGIMMSAAFCRVEFDIQIVWSTSFTRSSVQFGRIVQLEIGLVTFAPAINNESNVFKSFS